MGAAGDTRTAAAPMEEAAARVTPVEADRITAQAGRAEGEGAASSVAAGAAAAVDLEAVDRRAARRWRARVEGDRLEAADTELVDTAAVRHALRADIHRVRMAAELTAEQVTDTAADTDLAEPATAMAGTQETPVRITGTAGTTAVTAEALALRVQAVRTVVAVIVVRGRMAPTGTRTRTRATDTALTAPHRIAVIPA